MLLQATLVLFWAYVFGHTKTSSSKQTKNDGETAIDVVLLVATSRRTLLHKIIPSADIDFVDTVVNLLLLFCSSAPCRAVPGPCMPSGPQS